MVLARTEFPAEIEWHDSSTKGPQISLFQINEMVFHPHIHTVPSCVPIDHIPLTE